MALYGKPCRAFSSELMVRVAATGLSAYPDATVVCGRPERDPEQKNAVVNPTLLVEVLSPSTEAYDRGVKFASYRQVPTLQEYVLEATTVVGVEVYRRNPDGTWTLRLHGPGDTVRLLDDTVAIGVDALCAGYEEVREPHPRYG